jgi:type I restriction enzyme R subunit
MMTTGYDCPDILNLGLFRPIFSPTDFIQIKGRGTRKHDFREQLLFDDSHQGRRATARQDRLQALRLLRQLRVLRRRVQLRRSAQAAQTPRQRRDKAATRAWGPVVMGGSYEHLGDDLLASLKVEQITADGMKIDRMFFERFEDSVRENATIAAAVEAGQWDRVIDYVNREVFDKPDEYYTLDKLRKAAAVDRRLTLREILEKVFGLIPRFKSKDELLEEEFSKFVADRKPDPPRPSRPSRPTSRPTSPVTGCATSSTAGSSPIWRPTRTSPRMTSEPCPSSTARSSPSTSRTTCP